MILFFFVRRGLRVVKFKWSKKARLKEEKSMSKSTKDERAHFYSLSPRTYYPFSIKG